MRTKYNKFFCHFLPCFGMFCLAMCGVGILSDTGGTAWADVRGGISSPRKDTVMGTFTEGMVLEEDAETGDRILRSAPTPKDDPQPVPQPEMHVDISAPLPPSSDKK